MLYINKYRYLIGAIVGCVGGWLYWNYVGCASGTCPIKSNPYMMMGYGTFTGALIFDMIFNRNKPKKTIKNDGHD